MQPRGIITFVFDDGYTAVYTHVVPLLDKYGIPGVFAIPLKSEALERESGQKVTPLETWQHIHGRHELAAHGIHHKNLTTMPPEELRQELHMPHKTMGASTLVYPGGAYNNQVIAQAASIYKAARTVERGLEKVPPPKPLQLRTFNFSKRNFSAAKANALALYAMVTGSWLIETYHLLDIAPHPDMHSLLLEDFVRHLRFVSRIPIAKKTIREITAYL